MEKTELFDLAENLFEGMITDDTTDQEMEEAWADAMIVAEDMLTGLFDNLFI